MKETGYGVHTLPGSWNKIVPRPREAFAMVRPAFKNDAEADVIEVLLGFSIRHGDVWVGVERKVLVPEIFKAYKSLGHKQATICQRVAVRRLRGLFVRKILEIPVQGRLKRVFYFLYPQIVCPTLGMLDILGGRVQRMAARKRVE